MSNIDILYENGITLTERQRSFLSRQSWGLNKQMRRILKKYSQGFTYYEMKKILEQVPGNGKVNIDTVRRGLSQQTDIDSRLTDLEDKYGRMPLLKSDERRENPESGVSISVYKYNERYGQPPSHRELVEKQRKTGQMNFHEGLFEGTV